MSHSLLHTALIESTRSSCCGCISPGKQVLPPQLDLQGTGHFEAGAAVRQVWGGTMLMTVLSYGINYHAGTSASRGVPALRGIAVAIGLACQGAP